MKVGTTSTETIEYIVKFGPKKESERETEYFDDYDDAQEFYHMKYKDGFNVSAYEVTTKTVEKIRKMG